MKPPLTLARKFEILFDTLLAPEGQPYTLTQISEATGLAVNSLSRLQTGRIEDPRLSTLLILSQFFGLSLDYFQCQTEAECFTFLQAENARRANLPEIALRVRQMSQDVMMELSKMVDYIEHLNPPQQEENPT